MSWFLGVITWYHWMTQPSIGRAALRLKSPQALSTLETAQEFLEAAGYPDSLAAGYFIQHGSAFVPWLAKWGCLYFEYLYLYMHMYVCVCVCLEIYVFDMRHCCEFVIIYVRYISLTDVTCPNKFEFMNLTNGSSSREAFQNELNMVRLYVFCG